jgi:hypothetical protein
MLVTGMPCEFELMFPKLVVIITGLPGFTGLGIAFMSFRLMLIDVLSVDVATGLLGLFADLPVSSLSNLELKSEFISLFRCGLLKLEGVSSMGLPSRKLFTLLSQSCSPPHVVHIAYAVEAKLAVTTMRATVIRRILDLVIISPVFLSLLSIFNYISFTPKRKYSK